MKRRNLWILLAALAVVGILVFALLGLQGGKDDTKAPEGESGQEGAEPTPESTAEPTPEPTPVDPELPLDETPLIQDTEGSTTGPEEDPVEEEEPEPTEAPGEQSPDPDELPIFP